MFQSVPPTQFDTQSLRSAPDALERRGDLMKKRGDILPSSLPPRGVSREEAARVIGVSPSKFDALVADGRMPKPKIIDGRRVWDTRALDLAFDALPDCGGDEKNPWDDTT